MADALTATATQVRIDAARPDLPVHAVVADWINPQLGCCYQTQCGDVLAKVEGAILTTREATCIGCVRGGAPS